MLPISLISWAHHCIKKKLQNLPSWNKGKDTGNGKSNGHAIEVKNGGIEAKASSDKAENNDMEKVMKNKPLLRRPSEHASLANGEVIEMVMI